MPTQQSPPDPVPEARTIWRPSPPLAAEGLEQPSLWTSIRRGASNRCPVCGEGRVFSGFLRVVDACEVCHAPLGELRADDAPPYIVIFLTGHLLFPPVFWVEKTYEPPMWLHMVVWLPLFAIVCTLLLRPVKGAVVGWMMRLGFADHLKPRDGMPQDEVPATHPLRDV